MHYTKINEQPKDQTKALVIGASSLLGGAMIERLVLEGYQVVAVDNLPVDKWHSVPNSIVIKASVMFDFKQPYVVQSLLEEAAPIEEIYYLYQPKASSGYVKLSSLRNLINILDVIHLADCKKFFTLSSSRMFGVGDSPVGKIDVESGAIRGISVDAALMLMTEGLLREYGSENPGLRIYISRIENFFGASKGGAQPFPDLTNHYIYLFMKAKEEDREPRIPVYGNPKNRYSFLHVDDVVRGIRKVVSGGEPHRPIHLGDYETYTVTEFLDELSKVFGINYTTYSVSKDNFAFNPAVGSYDGLMNLGWKPEVSLPEGLRKVI